MAAEGKASKLSDAKSNRTTNDKSNIAYLAAFAFYGASMILPSTTLTLSWPVAVSLSKLVLQILAIALLLFCLTKSKFKKAKLLLALFLIAVVVIGGAVSGSFGLVWLALFVLAAQGVNLRQLAWTNLVVNIVFVVILAILAVAGIVDNVVMYRDESFRYAMGFLQPNSFGRALAEVSIGLFIWRFGTFKFTDYAVIALMGIACFIVSGSRTSTLIIISVISFMALSTWHNGESGVSLSLSWVSPLVFWMLVLLSFFLAFQFDQSSPIQKNLDELLTNRLYYMHYYVDTYPPTLFGQDLEGIATVGVYGLVNQLILDNSWIYSLEVFGLIPTIVLLFLMVPLIRQGLRNGTEGPFPYLLIISALFSFTEAIAYSPFHTYLLVGLSVLVLDREWRSFLRYEKPADKKGARA